MSLKRKINFSMSLFGFGLTAQSVSPSLTITEQDDRELNRTLGSAVSGK